jgi:short-subunit dehydrogenase
MARHCNDGAYPSTMTTALITGASSGLGADFARLFAADGYDLVLVARREDKLRELAAELKVKSTIIAADLSQHDAAAYVVGRLVNVEIDALVNNAGLGFAGAFVDIDLEKELEMIHVNIVALTQLTKLLLPPMVKRGRGRILNVASTASFQPGPLMAVYYATKAYVLSFSEALAEELRKTGVTVTALCPGPTATGFAAVANVGATRLFSMMPPMKSMSAARAGYEGMKRGRRVVVPGLKNKLLAESVRFTPRRLVTTIVRKMQEPG